MIDTASAKPQPRPTRDSAPFWEGLAAGELRLQRCKPCGALQHPPGPVCRECWSDVIEWTTAGGAGTIYSYTVVHRTTTPGFAADTPYIVAIVALAVGPRMTTNIVDCAIDSVRIGMPVRAVFDTSGPSALLKFAPTLEKDR